MRRCPRAVKTVGVRRARRRSVLAASLVVALGLATACGGSSASGEGGGDPAQTGADGKPLPGLKEFGLTEEELASDVEEVEALIASCMTEAGFEYIPADVQTVDRAQDALRVDPGYTEGEYKKRWGFGVTTRFDNVVKEIELGPQNLRIIESLSATDKAAYERTLYGEDPDMTFAFAFDEEDFSSTGGCTRKAVEQVFTKAQLSASYVNPKDVLVEEDPRVVEANANWVECMQDAGYEGYLDQDEIIGEFEERLEALTEGEDPATLTGAKAARLRKMQAEEIAISLTDHRCQIKHQRPAINAVEVELFGRDLP